MRALGWSLARPRNRDKNNTLDYEDNYFQENFSSKGVVFGIVDDVLVAIKEYQGSSGNVLSTVRTRGNVHSDRWEKGVGYRVVDSGGDGQRYSIHRIIEGNTGSNQSFTLNWVDGVCECGGWQMHGVPCVHGMAYFRWRNDWTLQQVVEQFVEKCHTYDYEQKLYSGSFVPVCMDMLQPDQTTLPPDVEGKRMAGRPKTVRLRLRSRYSHQPEKSPVVCSHCHQRGRNARTCQRRAALAKNTGTADTAQNSNNVLKINGNRN
ncbi:hypothetical protein IV203_032778 [Nitzschia inconspicua]|uniref:SWIM-type domain-containing protein n=1 Tax=Nitzschia inconspicua TaxID=303405 RepID=A0A9K3KKB4_9STRA|nr:hypothetical protein IV203_032778 [Nitzschia inconspicua]